MMGSWGVSDEVTVEGLSSDIYFSLNQEERELEELRSQGGTPRHQVWRVKPLPE